MNYIKLNPDDVILWFDTIRNLPNDKKTRGLDGFWRGQILSKIWLAETLNSYVKSPSNIYVFGGWIGVLSSILFQSSTFYINKLYNIDIDPWCINISNSINKTNKELQRFVAIENDMATYEYQDIVDIVINTSTEHVNDLTYNEWYDKIPKGTLIVLQGNDYFNCDEHIRCSPNLEEFNRMNNVVNPIYTDKKFYDIYNRFMSIFIKS